MAKLVTYIFIVSSLILWYLLLFGTGGGGSSSGGGLGISSLGVEATNGHGSQLEGRDFHHHGGSHHIRRNINHCWRRYDGYNLQNTIVNKKEQLKKPYGILCNFKCTWFFTISFPTCEFIYDYKLSCVLFTSLPDCTNVKCTLLNYFS
ncbi:uncharacterized protein LOC115626963 [Scaptodrosophila lebanonensis]|uniref:Uncharacterized protein LOC115626963 n=1 Tax=Drosophila lebanonensis TaxID=7225 RepID=A0A6J2TT76_DROLE|nr:uncharacterized protein LOC115626963 [Scaptodrosophila lebanonensis]